MTRIVLCVVACACVAAVAALAQPSSASAGWCWPSSCSGYGMLTQSTSTSNGCWFAWGEVCSYYNAYYNVALAKTCYPGCDWNYNTKGVVLYGFENHDRIRGKFSSKGGVVLYLQPFEVGMGGSLRAQVTWYADPASQINAAAIG